MVVRRFGSLLACSLCLFACTNTPAAEEEEGSGNYDDGTGLGEGECADMCGTPGCGTCPTADMVDGGGFQIDAKEVDNGQYALMLEVSFDASVLPPGCDWKSGFVPDEWSDTLDPTMPVVGVDWCDAAVFCQWAGKRLCGSLDGGAVDPDDAEDPAVDAWFHACSNAGASEFPYGAEYDPVACNGVDAGQADILPSGSLPSCEGGVAGLFDMSGNVWEWSNACAATPGDANTQCLRRGGSHFSDADNLRCGVNSDRARGARDNAVGFRCCG
jgi:formylglycine-generating enzyme required for sulfatase activity